MALGKIKADTLEHSTAGSLDTQYVVQGSAKAWVNLDGTASGATARDSFNVASMTDNGTGQYTATFTNNMNNDDYAHSVTPRGSTVVFGSIRDASYATSTFGAYIFNTSSGLTDATYVTMLLQGDLA